MQTLRTGTRIIITSVLLVGVPLTALLHGCDGGGQAQPSQESPAPGSSGQPGEPAAAGDDGPAEASDDGAVQPPDEEPAAVGQREGWTDEGYRNIFDFVANRHLAHYEDTGVFVDFGTPGGYKYIQGRWRSPWLAGREEGGRWVAYTDGIGATFRLPLTEAPSEARELVLRMRAVGSGQRMDVFVNGDDALPTVMDLPADWGIVRIPIPADRLRIGENMIRVHFARSTEVTGVGRTAGGFDWARLQPPGADPAPSHLDGAFGLTTTADGASALAAPVYGRLAWYLTVPEGGLLRLHARAEGSGGPEGEVPAVPTSLRLLVDGSEPSELWAGRVGVDPVPVEVDLSPWSGQAVRIELGGDFSVYDGRLLFVEPHIAVAERPARALGDGPLVDHVFIWLVDTLRSDYFTPYNADAPADTPNLTAFADRCQLFERHTVQGNSSLPASGSIHTATYPTVHGINDGSTRIDRALTVLGEAVESGGLDTALFSSNGYVTQSRGFGRGYDAYRNLIHEPGRSDTEYLWPIARDWLAERGEGSRWLAFLNTIDPHVPYDPPEDLLARYHPEPYTGSIRPRATGELLDGLGERGLSDADLRYLLALHYGEITYNDVWFGHAVEDLTELGFLDDTLVIITSDHGEGFLDHGRVGHGTSVYEEVVWVPLLLCHPSLGTGRIAVEVESIDIYPTILDAFGLEVPPSVQGISLLPLVADPTPSPNRPAFSYHQDFLRGLRLGRWKYHLRTGDNDNLYDLSESAIEGDDRRDQAPIAYRYMRDVMAFHLAFDETWRKSEWGFANNHSAAFAAHLDEAGW